MAIDNDIGIASTLTVANSLQLNATGIDVLNGFEQDLIAYNENGDLIIRDILIKD